ncbi:MAG TPA: RNB domain-containing ribonuclease, partial [Thermoanaerobaculia bacterium]|nr:RNB domain-containing ribonuclease [Thermoanaerobaculia bacterium]
MSNALPAPIPETLVGTLEAGPAGVRGRSRRRWLVPFDPKLTLELPVSGAGEVPEGHFAVVAVERGARGSEPRGRLLEVLGDVATPGVDVEVVLRHYGIPQRFPDEVLAAAASLPADPGPADWQGREDLRRQVVVTIDGESARDFDDAVSIERRPDGTFRLGVHIADVAHYVAEGSALDAEARRRGTSVYYPERVV